MLGIHQSQARQEEIYIYEQEGIKVAVLNYTYGTNGIALPGDMPYAVDLLEKDRMSRDLQKATVLGNGVQSGGLKVTEGLGCMVCGKGRRSGAGHPSSCD